MIMSDEAWYGVRNTPGVTGFIGSSGKGTKPIPLSPEEVKKFFKGVKKEGKATRWTDGKSLFKYSCITLLMLVFIGLFFYGLDALFAAIRGLF